MNKDIDYLSIYKTNTMYINSIEKGIYVTMVDLDISPKIKLALRVFCPKNKKDYNNFEIIKLKLEKGIWKEDSTLSLSQFNLARIKQFLEIINGLEISDLKTQRISLASEINEESLRSIIKTPEGLNLLNKMQYDPNIRNDIIALGYKREQLEVFSRLFNDFENYKAIYIKDNNINKNGEENIWQHFFEMNPWIFGYGLNYVFLHKVNNKLENTTTGATYNTSGKRVDALMRTKAIMSQYVLIEIKKPSSNLLQREEHRSGCWSISKDLTEAVSQIQKTVFDFVQNKSVKDSVKDSEGRSTGDEIYKVYPKSYFIIGSLKELESHDDKFICFQLFRNSLNTPEIITYDELYERAKCIVEVLSDEKI